MPRLRALATLLAASTLVVGCGGSPHAKGPHGEADAEEEPQERDVGRLAPIAPGDGSGDGPLVDVGAFRARFPAGFPPPNRTIRKLRDGDAVAFVSATADGVCLVLGAEEHDEAARKGRSLAGFEHGLVGEGGHVEAAKSFTYAGKRARTALFWSRDDAGERTYWRYLAVVDGSRLFAAIFMSKKEPLRRTPEVDAFLSSLHVGEGPVPTPREEPEAPAQGSGEIRI